MVLEGVHVQLDEFSAPERRMPSIVDELIDLGGPEPALAAEPIRPLNG